ALALRGAPRGLGAARTARLLRFVSLPPADLLELAAPLELVAERDRVDRLTLGVQVEGRLVDDPVTRTVEVACRQDFADRPDRTGGEHHRAEYRLLGIEILRWNRGGRRSLGKLGHA